MTLRALALAWTLCMVTASVLPAQEPPTLDRVEELASLGRAEEARDLLLAWWEAEGSQAPRREVQRGLWLRGRLTVDPAQAALDFRRLVIEYPGGPFSDMALFRLAQMAYALGDSAGAVEGVARLGREYPASHIRREAEAWLATAGPVPVPAGGMDPPPATVADSAEPPPEDPPEEPTPDTAAAASGVVFTAQLGAFSGRDRAETLMARVAEAGFEARLVTVPGSDLIRVRVGTFDSAEGAGAILRRLQDLGFTGALANDAHREQRVR